MNVRYRVELSQAERCELTTMLPKAKYSLRADVFRFAPESGLNSDIAGGPVRATNGLRDLVVHSSVCKAAPKDINWRLTIGFEFRIWCDLCWHLYFNLRLC